MESQEKCLQGKKRIPELLAPAGNLEKLKMAVLYGADAVYFGGKSYGLRAMGGNFSREDMAKGVAFAHQHGVKVYVTVNIFAHENDFHGLPEYLFFLQSLAIDGILVADLGVFSLARRLIPDVPLHVSTQANTTNLEAVKAWTALGAKRIVLARELSFSEIRKICEASSAEIEVFAHGAMCISYSGRCLLSSFLTGRDANRGACTHCCRWQYALTEKKRPGEYFPIEEDDRGTYILNSRDLCLLPVLDQLIGCGVDSIKIEGRMKSVHYVASVTKAYRMALDAYVRDPENFRVDSRWLEELKKVSHRKYTTGFALHAPTATDQIYDNASYEQLSEFIGVVKSYDKTTGRAVVEQRNHMECGETIELFQPHLPGFRQKLEDMTDEAGDKINCAPHAQQILSIRMKQPVEQGTILRREARSDLHSVAK